MLPNFEIFQTRYEDEPVWVASCATLEDALERTREMESANSGEYFIFDRQGQKFIDADAHQPARANTRILVADDHDQVRSGVCKLLQDRDDVEVVGEACNGKEAVERTRRLHPDVVIMDWSMPLLDGLSAAQMIKKFSPKTAIVMFSMHTNRMFKELARTMGMNGFVSKQEDGPELLRAIDAVVHKQKYFPAA